MPGTSRNSPSCSALMSASMSLSAPAGAGKSCVQTDLQTSLADCQIDVALMPTLPAKLGDGVTRRVGDWPIELLQIRSAIEAASHQELNM